MKNILIYIFILTLFMLVVFAGLGCEEEDDDEKDDACIPEEDDDDDDDNDDATNPFEDIPIDMTITFDNLTDNVEVIFDEYEIPHIFAANKKDLMFIVGYIMSRHRFFQMDFLRHLTSGRLTEYLYPTAGDLVLEADLAMRTRFLSNNGQLVFERIPELLSEEELELLNSFSDGVNAYLVDMKVGANGLLLPDEYSGTLIGLSGVGAEDIPDWTITDTFAIARYQQWDLSSTLGMELNLAELFGPSVPEAVRTDVVRFAPIEDTVILPDFYSKGKNGKSGKLLPDYYNEEQSERIRKAFENLPDDVIAHLNQIEHGSNNWVVSGDYTASGNPMLANDPHLSLLNPSVFYEMQMDTSVFGSEGDLFSAYGVAFPGIPAIMIGMNQNIAWGVTMAGYDVEDIYEEELDNADPTLATSVLFKGSYVDIEYSEQVFKLAPATDAPTTTIEIPYVPHHGPFLNSSVEDSGNMTNRWTGHEPSNDLPAFMNLLWAKDSSDFFTAVNNFQVGAQNFVCIDMEGNIGYYPHAKVPIREMGAENIPPWLPMPGQGDYEWDGYIADEDLPQADNPTAGYVVTANNDMVGTLLDNDPNDDAHYLYWDRAVGFRAKRIDDLLNDAMAGKSAIDLDQMQKVQNDTLTLEAQRFLQHLLTAADNDPTTVTDLGLGDAITRLEAWDFSTPIGIEFPTGNTPSADQVTASVTTSIFYAFWTRMPYAVFADEFDDEGAVAYNAPMPGRDALWYLLENPTTSETGEELFNNTDTPETETRDDILLQTLADALEWCESADGFNTADMNKWNWGELHQTLWSDFLGNLGYPFDLKGPYPIDGASYTVDVAGSSGFTGLSEFGDPEYSFTTYSGPTVRWAVEATEDGMVARAVIPGGESGKVDSEHYNDQAEMYLTNQTHDAYFTTEQVVEHAEQRFVFEPAK